MSESKQIIRTQKAIKEALLKLVLERSFDNISVTDICEQALVTRATFYKYYEDKFHLIKCIIQDYKEEIFIKRLNKYHFDTAKELYMKIAEICVDFVEKNVLYFYKLSENEYNDKLRVLLLQIIDESIETLLEKENNVEQFKVPTKILSKFFTGGFAYMSFYLLQGKAIYDKKILLNHLEVLLDAIISGITISKK